MAEQWLTMKDAAKVLGISASKVSRLAAIGAIQVRESVINRRIKLVDVEEIRELIRTQGIK